MEGKKKSVKNMWGILKDLQNTLRQVTIVLFCNLCSIRWTLKDGRIVVNIFNMYHDGRVVFFQVIRCCQAKLILVKIEEKKEWNLWWIYVTRFRVPSNDSDSGTECKLRVNNFCTRNYKICRAMCVGSVCRWKLALSHSMEIIFLPQSIPTSVACTNSK